MREIGVDRFDVRGTNRDRVKVPYGQTGKNITLQTEIHFQIFFGCVMQRNLPHEALQQRPMKDQHERTKDRQCNPGTALPSSVRRNFCLAIFAHEGGTLFPREESANNATVAALYERRRCNAQQSKAQLRSST